jgi:methenyltetrahydrofolate cyclohydrolase
MKHLSLEQFATQINSKEPVPGGGSVSAHAGAQAAALLAMYCRLSRGKKGLESLQPLISQTLEETERILPELMDFIEKDSAAYSSVVNSFALPKNTVAEKEIRSAAIQESFAGAARVPLVVASRCLRLLELISAIAGHGNNNAITDIGVGNLLAWAGLQGALYNVSINLDSIQDKTLADELRMKADRIKTNGAVLYQKNASVVETLLA